MSNAANAEETASASEELSAQAEQMKSKVAEMMVLVNGSGNGARSGLSQTIEGQKKAGQKALAMATPALETSKNEPPAVYLQKEMDPEQVIPMDDEEFKDF